MQRSIILILLVSINIITYYSICNIVLIWLLKEIYNRNYRKEADTLFCLKKLAINALNESNENVISVLFIGFEFFKASNFIYLFYLGSSLVKFNCKSSLY